MANKSGFSNKEEAKWMTRIQKSLEWRAMHSYEDQWNDIRRIYNHKFARMDVPHFNLLYIMGQSLIPNLVYQNPGILNTPSSGQMVFWASFFDSIDNWWIRHAEIKDIAREVVLSSYLFNTTATQIGYDFDTELDQIRRNDPDVFPNIKGVVDRSRSRNAPWVDFIPSHRFIDAPGTRTMRNCPWCAKFVAVPTKLLKDRKGLKNVASSVIPDEVLRYERALWDTQNANQYTGFWQIHDAETGKWALLSTSGKFLMPFTEDPLQVYGLPFEVVSFNDNVESQWATPDSMYIKTQQMESDETRLQGMYQRRQSINKLLYNSNKLDQDSVTRILETIDACAIPMDLGEDDDIRKHVWQMTTDVDQLKLMYQESLFADVKLLSGQGPNQLGDYAPGRRSATEANIVEGNSNVRMSDRRSKIANMIKNHTTRANVLISRNWKQNVLEQVVGVDGALYWVEASAKQLNALKEGLVTEVNVESLAPVSRERRKQEAADLLQMIGAMQQVGANPLPLLQQLLSQYEWVDVRRVLPQMTSEMNIDQFASQQAKLLTQGPMGPTAAANVQGVAALANRAPQEIQNVE